MSIRLVRRAGLSPWSVPRAQARTTNQRLFGSALEAPRQNIGRLPRQGLEFPIPPIELVRGVERLVRPAPDDPALIQNQDAVRPPGGGQPVGDDQRGPSREQDGQRS